MSVCNTYIKNNYILTENMRKIWECNVSYFKHCFNNIAVRVNYQDRISFIQKFFMYLQLRISGIISNAPYLLVLDCDMYCNDPTSARQAMCFHLDPEMSKDLGFVQYPQTFYNVSKNDIYDGQTRSAYKVHIYIYMNAQTKLIPNSIINKHFNLVRLGNIFLKYFFLTNLAQ